MEILAPAGNKEAFFAAIEAGADAIYLGLKSFSARARANNFSKEDLPFLLRHAHSHGAKIYVALNTLIKNQELPELVKTLYFLDKLQVDAVIFQDWAVAAICKKLFPKLALHASTQMGFHNSLEANFAQKKGVARVVLAREITKLELQNLRKKTKTELELFAHGSLCYSVSGMCLFSSFVGGFSGNRGQCKQPCRRSYNGKYYFNLCDLQLLQILPELKEIGVDSLKIEGRMKSAEYVRNVVAAYKQEKNSVQDFGRAKSEYFFSSQLKKPIIDYPFTGKLLGQVIEANGKQLKITSDTKLQVGQKIRIMSASGHDAKQLKIKPEMLKSENCLQNLPDEITQSVNKGNKVFLTGCQDYRPSQKLQKLKFDFRYNPKIEQKILPKASKKTQTQRELFVKIDSPEWLRKIDLRNIDRLILDFEKIELENFDFEQKFIQKFADKIVVELPNFISENSLTKYQNLITKLYRKKIKRFSCFAKQKDLLLPGCTIYYKDPVMNDLAALELESDNFFYPQEGELANDYQNKNGVYPLYFSPKLFYSRCPIQNFAKIEVDQFTLLKTVKNGFTIVYPDKPVSIMEEKQNLYKKGYRRFLLDLSFCKPSKHLINKLIREYAYPTDGVIGYKFNFKRGLK